MTEQTFLDELTETLELEEPLTLDSDITFNSIEILLTISFLDEHFGVKVNAEQLKNVSSVNDILCLGGGPEKLQ